MKLDRSDLHAYQVAAVEFVLDLDRVSLWLDLGLGKTIVSLTAIVDWLDSCAAARVLVIAPLRVARNVWAQEAASWAHTDHLTVALALGTAAERRAAIDGGAEVTVINRENVAWLVKDLKARRKPWPFDTVIVDESSSFKNRSSARWRALKSALPYIDRIVLLTGTPAGNGLIDLWAQQYLVDGGAALGRTLTAYRSRYFEPDYMGWAWTERPGAEDDIHERLRPTTRSLAAADYLDMPERFDVRIPVYMDGSLDQMYSDFKRKAVIDLETATVEAVSAGVLAGKLLQFAQGALYTEGTEYEVIHDLKLDVLAELVEDNPAENLLIAYRYQSDLARLMARFPEAETLNAPDAIARWNAGDIRMLLAHPASAGHGINLQHGGSTLVWFGLEWSLELYQQMIGRLHRQGQTRPVRVIHIVVAGTFDDRVLSVIEDKNATQATLLAAVKEELQV